MAVGRQRRAWCHLLLAQVGHRKRWATFCDLGPAPNKQEGLSSKSPRSRGEVRPPPRSLLVGVTPGPQTQVGLRGGRGEGSAEPGCMGSSPPQAPGLRGPAKSNQKMPAGIYSVPTGGQGHSQALHASWATGCSPPPALQVQPQQGREGQDPAGSGTWCAERRGQSPALVQGVVPESGHAYALPRAPKWVRGSCTPSWLRSGRRQVPAPSQPARPLASLR